MRQSFREGRKRVVIWISKESFEWLEEESVRIRSSISGVASIAVEDAQRISEERMLGPDIAAKG
jgi:hypothetical protein